MDYQPFFRNCAVVVNTRTALHSRVKIQELLALLYVRVPSGLVAKEASPAPALLERLSAASNSSLPTAAASISITEGAREPGRALSCPLGAVVRAPWPSSFAIVWCGGVCIFVDPISREARRRRCTTTSAYLRMGLVKCV